MNFAVDDSILKHYPSLHLGVIVLHNLDNSMRISVVNSLLQGAFAEKKREFKEKKIDDDARINVWRKTFRSFEVNPEKKKSSLETLLKAAIKDKAEVSNDPLSNINDYISLKYCVPIQTHDSDQLCGDLELNYAVGEEPYKEVGSDKVKQTRKGEIVYKDEAGVVCRAWNHKRCDRTKITSKTRNAIVLIEDMGVLGRKHLEEAMKDLVRLVEKYCKATATSYVLEHNRKEIDLGVEGLYGISDDASGEQKIFQTKSISKMKKPVKKKGVIKKASGKSFSQRISNLIKKTLKDKLGEEVSEVKIDYPKDQQHGDYSSNIALQLAKQKGENPREFAGKLIEAIKAPDWIEKIEVAGPGFINFYLSKHCLATLIEDANIQGDSFGHSGSRAKEKILVEFAHPNTHKAFHIGHLRNISLGESLVRILESQGIKVFRANYQGDVGPHVAKCLWGYMKTDVPKMKTAKEKASFLGQVYAKAAKAYEADEKAKEEIHAINKQIYSGDQEIMPLWEETRKWSLNYFDEVYKRFGSRFDRLYFESEVWELGIKTVKEGLGKGVFEESEGAIVYDGEKVGLHKRVFITSKGTATYEGKEVGLAQMENSEFDFDKKIHVVANEQAGYFKVVFSAIEEVTPELKGRQQHISYGMVRLDSGKMSSRTGDVITAEYLLDEAASKVKEYVDKTDLSEEEKAEVTEKVSMGAVKFAMLHATASNDIVFDLEKSTKLEGASGPYLQYAYARIKSIINKAEAGDKTDYTLFNDDDWFLAKHLTKFQEVVTRASIDLSSHHITHYLLELASKFSSWYDKNHVIKAEDELLKNSRVKLINAVAHTISNGLTLLGIQVPERM